MVGFSDIMSGASLLGGLFGGGNSGATAAGMQEELAREALALQKQIYGDTTNNTLPYRTTGSAATNRLYELLGLGSNSLRSYDDIRNELLPTYTTKARKDYDRESLISMGWDRAKDLIQNALTEKYGDEKLTQNMQHAQGLFERAQQLRGSGPNYVYGTADANERELMDYIGQPFMTNDVVDNAALDARAQYLFDNQSLPEGYGALMESFGLDKFEADPGYQFRKDEGEQAINRAAAARGTYFDPSTIKGLTQYNQDLGSQEYRTAEASYNNDRDRVYNMLTGQAGLGLSAVGTQAAAGQGYANAATDLLTGIGNVRAAGYMNDQANRGSMFNMLSNLGQQYSGGGGSSYYPKTGETVFWNS